MKAIIQLVKHAKVTVDGTVRGSINQGFLVLLGIEQTDTLADAEILAQKTANLRIFCDSDDKMNLSLLQVEGQALVISNFTLCANTKKGNRPSFTNAMHPEAAQEMYDKFCLLLKENGVQTVEKGIFGADMQVELLNDGPVTITLDTTIWRQ